MVFINRQGKKEELKRRLLEMFERYQQRENKPAPHDPGAKGQLLYQQRSPQADVGHESQTPMKTPGRQATERQGSKNTHCVSLGVIAGILMPTHLLLQT